MATHGEARDGEVTVDGLRLHYREWGSPDAPDLLILHGLTGHAWEFDGLAARLSADYHVVVLNQRGHGASDPAPSYTPGVMAEDIASVIVALRLSVVRVVGHSMGGINAWTCAARHPDLFDRLVIIDVGPDALEPDEVQHAWLESLEHSLRAAYADPEEAVTEYLAGQSGDTIGQLEEFARANLRQREDGLWTWRFDAAGLNLWVRSVQSSSDLWDALRQVACPTLVIRAGDGALSAATAERMIAALPNARSVEIPDSGHDVHFDQPERLFQELHQFLTER